MAAAADRPFPSRTDHEQRWLQLAAEIAQDRERITETPQKEGSTPKGELIVIGSGIETVGFASSDEILLREADQVFYCVADPVTMVWIKELRPDAYDLYVLYDDSKLRYLTYMQMTEAMLHFVRRGQKVVAVYYGHPGIFVLSTHRAIQIARREGHRATMRAAVSALDTLCADLGVDPSHPGMQTFEATGMLIRNRRPDPSLHLILWQVGLVGDLGFRRAGFLNSGFPILLDYLEEVYGAEHEVVHYIGSRYPGIPPRIDRHTIKSLRDPAVQTVITGISTFYIPPSEAVPSDPVMLRKLGLLKSGEPVSASAPATPLRQIDRYGSREMKAFDDFATFRIPPGYHWQEDTAAARFVLALREDGSLRDLYTQDPRAAVASWKSPGLSPRARGLLALGDGGAMQIAAKGVTANSDGQATICALLKSNTQSRNLLRRMRRTPGLETLSQWSAEKGYDLDWTAAPGPLEITIRQQLAPWTGLYVDPERELSIFIFGRLETAAANRVYVNGIRIVRPSYERGTLKWTNEGGNTTHGHLQVDLTTKGRRRLVGMVWPSSGEPDSRFRVALNEHRLSEPHSLAALAGHFRGTTHDGRTFDVDIKPRAWMMDVILNGTAFEGPIEVGTQGFRLGDIEIPFSQRISDNAFPPYLRGTHALRIGSGSKLRRESITFSDRSIMFGNGLEVPFCFDGSRTKWTDGPNLLSWGEATHLLDPITLRPMLFGKLREMGSHHDLSFVGMTPVDEDGLASLLQHPRLALPHWAWAHLVRMAAEASHSGGLFFWHHWEKTSSNLRRIRAAIELSRQ